MSSMVSRWPVLVSLPVSSADRDDAEGGRLSTGAAERLFARAREVYLARCRTLEGRAVEVLDVRITRGDASLAGVEEATVSVSVVEVFPDRFTMNVRIRPAGGEGIAADGRCDVFPGGPVTDEVRDELIAFAHEASHYH